MTIIVKTIPDLLTLTKGNKAELARKLNCSRGTIIKYLDDEAGMYHAVINGRLMLSPAGRGKQRWKGKA